MAWHSARVRSAGFGNEQSPPIDSGWTSSTTTVSSTAVTTTLLANPNLPV